MTMLFASQEITRLTQNAHAATMALIALGNAFDALIDGGAEVWSTTALVIPAEGETLALLNLVDGEAAYSQQVVAETLGCEQIAVGRVRRRFETGYLTVTKYWHMLVDAQAAQAAEPLLNRMATVLAGGVPVYGPVVLVSEDTWA